MDFSPAFTKFLPLIHSIEGGHTVDEGGDTLYGIARVFHPDEPWPITRDRADEILYQEYWLPLSCDLLPTDIAFYLVDMAINQGQSYAVTTLQSFLGVAMDGRMGPGTIKASQEKDSRWITGLIHAHRAKYYATRGGPEADGLQIRLRTLAIGTYGKEGVA